LEFPYSQEYLTAISGSGPGETREKTREKIMRLVGGNPSISMQELASKLEISAKGVEWQIRELKKSGHLKRIGAAKWRKLGTPESCHKAQIASARSTPSGSGNVMPTYF
jgi:predicted HTH transcriptional regulator